MDTTQLCRVCLKDTADISIFDRDEDLQYSTKIKRCVNIVISDDDGLPNMICRPCVGELTVAYDFVQKCEASDRLLRCPDVVNSLTEEVGLKADDDIKKEEGDVKIEDNNCEIDYDVSCGTEIFGIEDSSENKIDFSKDLESSKRKSSKKVTGKRDKKELKRSSCGSLQCVLCGLLTNCQSAMETHMRTHTGEKPFQCETCNTSFPTKGSLKRHIVTYHTKRERKFTCETCGNSFFSKSDIITHMRIHTDEKPYVCPYCSRGFRQVASLIRHKRMHTGERPYSCHICGKTFADKNLVKRHMNTHSDEKKFSCHLCNKSVKSKSALNMHLSLHSNEKRIICSYCGMALSTKGNLQTHIRRIHSEKSGDCNICLKTFPDLQEHMRKHTGERPFLCNMCSQTFSTKRSLTHHIAFKHENSTKFKCSIGSCSKTFPRAMMLEFHLLKQHTNHTPYICQHCSRGFFRTSDLSRHLKVSHLELQINMPIKTDDL